MAELSAGTLTEGHTQPRFFVWMAGVCVLIAFGGFTPTYFAPIASGTLREVSLAVHVHGFLFFGWTLLFLLQATLINRGNAALHRSLGMIGISWATAMVIFGLLVSFLSNASRFESGSEFAFIGVLSGSSAMIMFGVLVTFAIRNVRRSDWHKRLMLLATTAILGAATARLWLPVLNFEQPPMWLWRVTQDLPIAALLVYDWRTLGRPHVVTLVGGMLLLAVHILTVPVAETQAFQALAQIWFGFAP